MTINPQDNRPALGPGERLPRIIAPGPTSQQLAANCRAAAARLRATGDPSDARDAAALEAAADIHFPLVWKQARLVLPWKSKP